MAMVRIASLAAICAVAFVESAYAGVRKCARPNCRSWFAWARSDRRVFVRSKVFWPQELAA